MKVLKFGGSSLATSDRIQSVAEIVRLARNEVDLAVVVSALGGVTDALAEAAEAARRHLEDASSLLAALEERHLDTAREVADDRDRDALASRIRSRFAGLADLLHGVALVGEVSPRSLDRILACGELLSAPLVAAAFRRAGLDALDVDAREWIVTETAYGQARPVEVATGDRIRAWFADHGETPVVTGFIGATVEGETTTLGRGGSDFSASIVAVAVEAETLELWTDVDGVMSADPRCVHAARPIERLRYDELMELSHFGAKVVHPPSVHPVRSHGIPLWIRNTLRPELPGTLVSDEVEPEENDNPVRGITSISRVAMARLEGDGMVGVPGVAMRLFGALARRGISVILITQGSSEHSICFAIAPDDLESAREAIGEEFQVDRRAGDIDDLTVEDDVAVVTVVGAAMRQRPGIAGRLFSVLGDGGINVRAIAQGSSELNISMVVKQSDRDDAIRAIHQAFFEVQSPAAHLFLAGVGGVGTALLSQLAEAGTLPDRPVRESLLLAGVANSKSALVDPDGLDPATAASRLRQRREEGSPEGLVTAALSSPARLRIFVDCTASDEMATDFERLLAGGVSVVTANKKPLASDLEQYAKLQQLVSDGSAGLYHEATVGAGLPVVRTLADLLASGDRVVRIEGVLSGTASFLAGELDGGVAFSRAVERAGELGYTEPDPRDDLMGEDVARKLLILARMAGASLERIEIQIDPWLPAEGWTEMPREEFAQRLPDLDAGFENRRERAAVAGKRLAYLASWDPSGSPGARVALAEIGSEHPCFNLDPGENLIAFYTRRYGSRPLVVRGPGAGPEVTAGGVHADILRAVLEQGRQS
jgi:aspartokinase/homoserine dehydrogenase 1